MISPLRNEQLERIRVRSEDLEEAQARLSPDNGLYNSRVNTCCRVEKEKWRLAVEPIHDLHSLCTLARHILLPKRVLPLHELGLPALDPRTLAYRVKVPVHIRKTRDNVRLIAVLVELARARQDEEIPLEIPHGDTARDVRASANIARLTDKEEAAVVL